MSVHAKSWSFSGLNNIFPWKSLPWISFNSLCPASALLHVTLLVPLTSLITLTLSSAVTLSSQPLSVPNRCLLLAETSTRRCCSSPCGFNCPFGLQSQHFVLPRLGTAETPPSTTAEFLNKIPPFALINTEKQLFWVESRLILLYTQLRVQPGQELAALPPLPAQPAMSSQCCPFPAFCPAAVKTWGHKALPCGLGTSSKCSLELHFRKLQTVASSCTKYCYLILFFFFLLVNFVHGPKSRFSFQDKLLSPALNKVTSTPSFTVAIAVTAGNEE